MRTLFHVFHDRNVKLFQMNRFLRPAAPTLLIPAAAIGMTAWILRHLGFLVGLLVDTGEGDKFDFAEIFSQTRDADLTLHWILPILCGALFYGISLGLSTIVRKKAHRVVPGILSWCLLFLAALVACLAFTQVNDIRFCHLLGKLIPLMDKL